MQKTLQLLLLFLSKVSKIRQLLTEHAFVWRWYTISRDGGGLQLLQQDQEWIQDVKTRTRTTGCVRDPTHSAYTTDWMFQSSDIQ